MTIYLIPGLGADERMYAHQLKVLPNAVVLNHLPPVKGQPLPAYAARVAALIDTSRPFALVGTSLGGMVAMELSRIINPAKIVLMASVKTRDEMPAFIRSMRVLNLHKLVPGTAYKSFNNLLVKRLDSRGDSPAAKVIMDMTNDAPPQFISWAINAVINWRPPAQHLGDIIHIHGTNDTLFPYKNIKNAIPIKNGSHVMNITMSYEVNKALLRALGM